MYHSPHELHQSEIDDERHKYPSNSNKYNRNNNNGNNNNSSNKYFSINGQNHVKSNNYDFNDIL